MGRWWQSCVKLETLTLNKERGFLLWVEAEIFSGIPAILGVMTGAVVFVRASCCVALL